MYWRGIIRDRTIGSGKVSEDENTTAITHCHFIKDILSNWPNELPLPALSKVIFMHDNDLAHAVMITTELLSSMRFKGDTLIK